MTVATLSSDMVFSNLSIRFAFWRLSGQPIPDFVSPHMRQEQECKIKESQRN